MPDAPRPDAATEQTGKFHSLLDTWGTVNGPRQGGTQRLKQGIIRGRSDETRPCARRFGDVGFANGGARRHCKVAGARPNGPHVLKHGLHAVPASPNPSWSQLLAELLRSLLFSGFLRIRRRREGVY